MSTRIGVGAYWHTLRHLRPIQIYGRLWFRLARPKADLSPAPVRRHFAGTWQRPARRAPRLVGPGEFVLLGEQGALDDVGWDGPQREKLWRYNQHYFDDLNCQFAEAREGWHRVLLEDWVKSNPPGVGTGWEPYPTSLRIVNWIKWTLAGNPLPEGCVRSLAVQTRWLRNRLEWHLLGNHLFANAKALVYSGLFFDGEEARRWLGVGLQLVEKQLSQQVLPDGGNFERSTMYHAVLLEDMLDLINCVVAFPGCLSEQHLHQWRRTAVRQLLWLRGMTHPDGEISLFNDAAFNVAPSPAELDVYARRLLPSAEDVGFHHPFAVSDGTEKLRMIHWADSGYVRLEGPNALAILDVAQVGPDYLPGHAHADTLSFELSVFGHRVIVNGGTSRYGSGADRLRERQTASHSTVEVNGESSSEVWAGFRVARRAYPFDLKIEQAPKMISVACSHDGYMRLHGKPVHRRKWRLGECDLEVIDTVQGRHERAVARYILHPSIRIEANSSQAIQLLLPGGRRIAIDVQIGRGRLQEASFAPEFGKVLPTRCLAVDLNEGVASVRICWS